jgi:large-conductance mechanosensitive channel
MRKWLKQFLSPKPRWVWALRLSWVFIFVLFVALLSVHGMNESSALRPLEKLRIYSGSKDRVALWDRDKAVEFGLTQVATLINYLFVAAAAILGLVSKILIDPLTSSHKKGKPIQPTAAALLKHTAIGCFFSMLYGFTGATYLAQIPDSEKFSVYEEVGGAAACQEISFLLAALLLIFVASNMIRRVNESSQQEPQEQEPPKQKPPKQEPLKEGKK